MIEEPRGVRRVLGVALVAVGCWSAGALASEPEASACDGQREVVRGVVTTAFRTLRGYHKNALPGPQGIVLRDQKIEKLLTAHIAPERFTASVLKGAWERASPAHKVRWRRVLGTLLHRRLARALRDPLRYALLVDGVTVEPTCDASSADVRLTERRRGRHVAITLQFVLENGAWRVWDVWTDEASLVRTWRPRFGSIATERGLEALDHELDQLAERMGVPRESLGGQGARAGD